MTDVRVRSPRVVDNDVSFNPTLDQSLFLFTCHVCKIVNKVT
jgi:hypothetical protein